MIYITWPKQESIIFTHIKTLTKTFSTHILHFYKQLGHKHWPTHYKYNDFYKCLHKLCKSYGIHTTNTICTVLYLIITVFCNGGLTMLFSEQNLWSFLNLNVVMFDGTVHFMFQYICNVPSFPP
jgi:hypothetical protein